MAHIRYMVLNGNGNVSSHFDGDGETYDDAGAHDAALREASMMASVGAVVAGEVPDPYTGESDASASSSAAPTDSGATAEPTDTSTPEV